MGIRITSYKLLLQERTGKTLNGIPSLNVKLRPYGLCVWRFKDSYSSWMYFAFIYPKKNYAQAIIMPHPIVVFGFLYLFWVCLVGCAVLLQTASYGEKVGLVLLTNGIGFFFSCRAQAFFLKYDGMEGFTSNRKRAFVRDISRELNFRILDSTEMGIFGAMLKAIGLGIMGWVCHFRVKMFHEKFQMNRSVFVKCKKRKVSKLVCVQTPKIKSEDYWTQNKKWIRFVKSCQIINFFTLLLAGVNYRFGYRFPILSYGSFCIVLALYGVMMGYVLMVLDLVDIGWYKCFKSWVVCSWGFIVFVMSAAFCSSTLLALKRENSVEDKYYIFAAFVLFLMMFVFKSAIGKTFESRGRIFVYPNIFFVLQMIVLFSTLIFFMCALKL